MIATPKAENETDVGLVSGNNGQVDFFLDHENEFPAFVAGFGAGKTYVGLQKLLDLSLYNYQHTGCGEAFDYIAIEPSFPMVKRILYRTLFRKILKPAGISYIDHSKDNTDPHIILPWKATILFYSAKIPDTIVGTECAGAYADEAHLMAHLAWTNTIYRVRDSRAPLRQTFATFTPQLPAWTHEWWGKEEIDGEPNPTGYKVYHASTRDNPYLPDGYADMIASECEEGMDIAAVEGHFCATKIGRVYHTFDPARNKSGAAEYDPELPLAFAFDFNPGAVGVTVEICQQSGPHFFIVDEINIKDYSLEKTCGEILDRYGSLQRASVTVYGDGTGHRTTSQRSEYDVIMSILGESGHTGKGSYVPPFRVPVTKDVPLSNPSVANRCAAVRTLLCDSTGTSRLFIHPRCKKLLRDMQRVVHEAYHKQQQGSVYRGNVWDLCKCDGSVTHASDAAGYWIFRVRPGHDAFVRQTNYQMK